MLLGVEGGGGGGAGGGGWEDIRSSNTAILLKLTHIQNRKWQNFNFINGHLCDCYHNVSFFFDNILKYYAHHIHH